MDDSILKPLNEDGLFYILEGDPKLRIFEYIADLSQRSKRNVQMYWPRTIWEHYVEHGRITHRQFNVLLSVYQQECALEQAAEAREKSINFEKDNPDEKIINVKFA